MKCKNFLCVKWNPRRDNGCPYWSYILCPLRKAFNRIDRPYGRQEPLSYRFYLAWRGEKDKAKANVRAVIKGRV